MPRKPRTVAERVATAQGESRWLDFKERFDPKELPEWLELIKDFVAMANSGGGLIVVGVCNHGQPATGDVQPVLDLDPAQITDKIESYTHVHLEDFEISEVVRNGSRVAVIAVGPSLDAPIAFTRAGTYPDPGKKYPKTAFAKGTVYFRHGAKSEPATTADLRRFIDRRLDRVREQWKAGMRLVTAAPEGAHLALVEATGANPTATPTRFRLTNDPAAPVYGQLSPDQTHPYRQAQLLPELNKRLGPGSAVNSYDLLSVRRAYGIDAATRPDFVYQPHWPESSPQYSEEFIGWLFEQAKANSQFFKNARAKFYKMTKPKAANRG
jgi:Putative DNA-binding domain